MGMKGYDLRNYKIKTIIRANVDVIYTPKCPSCKSPLTIQELLGQFQNRGYALAVCENCSEYYLILIETKGGKERK
jgi:transcription elongation factor Elf1